MLHLMQAMAAALPAAPGSSTIVPQPGPVQQLPQEPPSAPAPVVLPPGPDSPVGPAVARVAPQPSPVQVPPSPSEAVTAIVEYRISFVSPEQNDGAAAADSARGDVEVDGEGARDKRKLEDIDLACTTQEQVVTCVRKEPHPPPTLPTDRAELLQCPAKKNEAQRTPPISVPAPSQAKRGRSKTPKAR